MEETSAFQRILTAQLARYPRMEIQDLYKLIHQTALGSEHAVKSEPTARDWLERELHQLANAPPEPVLDTISPNGRIARINLRPYLAQGYDPGALLEAFIKTANEYHGTPDDLLRYGVYAEQMAQMGALPFAPAAIGRFISAREAEGWPAVHHSTVYEATYHPAYRVVAVEYIRINLEDCLDENDDCV